MASGQPRQAHRPPVRAGAGIEDALLLGRAQRPRTRPRDRPPRRAPRPTDALALAGLKPPITSGRHCRGRAAHRPRDRARLLAGEKARDHLTLRTRSEPASTVCHVRPSFGAFSRGDRKPPSRAGRPPQPFSRSVGSSARRRAVRGEAPTAAVSAGFTDYGASLGAALSRPFLAAGGLPVLLPYLE